MEDGNDGGRMEVKSQAHVLSRAWRVVEKKKGKGRGKERTGMKRGNNRLL